MSLYEQFRLDGQVAVVTGGGRVLAVTAIDVDIPTAVQAAYGAIEGIHFDDAYWRRDIGYRALQLSARS